jgi:peptidoglycan hydrolase-like protein with peptidoglycan-binding domain
VKKVRHFGFITYWSVVKYQKANGLPITGRVDAKTREKLNEWYYKNILLDWLK